MFDFLKKVFGTKYDRDVKIYSPVVEQINNFAEQYKSYTNDQLRNNTIEFKKRIKDHLAGINEDLDQLLEKARSSDLSAQEELFNQVDELKKERNTHLEEILKSILPEAFATVKETATRFSNNETLVVEATQQDRDIAANKEHIVIEGEQAVFQNTWKAAGVDIVWNMIHYDVQLIGGMVLHDGKIAEMATGEGKTLVATLPAYLNGLSGQGVHVVTVNDYLARRDSEWIGPIFEFLHLTIDCIDKHRPNTQARRKAYNCDITYGTNNEFGFDYLRDNMVRSLDERVQREHNYAMIDEVDSVLVDDARTPLIISGPVPEGADEQEYIELNPKVEGLVNAQKSLAISYLAEAKKLFKDGIVGTDEGEAGVALLRAHRSLPKHGPLIKYLSEEGVKVLLQKTENFYMQEQSKNMPIVDKPLYFVIDEKNKSVELTDLGIDYLSKGENDPSFFLMPDISSEMMEIEQKEKSGEVSLAEEKQSLINDYSVKSRRLHSISQLLKAYTLFENDQEYVVMDGQVKIVDEQTGRMMDGRRYSDGLHQALEAKERVDIGKITQTYATVTLQNYFRMFHKLSGMTGTAETEAGEFWEIYKLDVVVIPTNRPIVRDDREDLIYKTAREKYNAVINQIGVFTEQGRPILVGTTSVEISEMLSRLLDSRSIAHNVLNAKQHQREADIVAVAGKAGNVTIATNMAGRGTDIKISDEVKTAGGLAIIATERHDSRRVDRQLRGRAGRQGDPGSSQFYVSLEDNLMRLFQTERIAGMMDKMGHKEGEVIQHSMMSKSIERAQKKVEENNFGIRKRLLEYDDVMNIQREAIYKKRDHALSGTRLSVDIYNMFDNLVGNIVYGAKSADDYNAFTQGCLSKLSLDLQIEEDEFKTLSADQLMDKALAATLESYASKKENIKKILMPVINNVFENQSHKYKRILIPYVDGSKHPLPITADLKRAVDSEGQSIGLDIEQAVTLALIDDKWKEHLRAMDELKESVQSASFEQKDPLVIYKMEAYNLFETLIHRISEEVISYLMRGNIVIQGEEVQEAKEQKTDLTNIKTNKEEEARRAASQNAGRGNRVVETIVRTEDKVRRNDSCPCGSGKKYKHCHGR